MAGGFSIKQFLPRTLFGRSLMILVTPVVLIQVIATYMFFDRHWSKMTTRLAYGVAGEVAVLTDSFQGDMDHERLISAAARHLDMDVTFKQGGTLPKENEPSIVQVWESVVAQKLEGEIGAQIQEPYVIHTDFTGKKIEVFVQLDKGVLLVTFPQRRLFSSSGYIFLLWMICSSFLLLVVAIMFMRNQIRPIRKLAAAAERFGKGRDTPFYKPEGAREVRQAGHAFLDMRRRIERAITQRTEMLAGVSHDLRTPLTRMKLQVEMMPEGSDKEEMRQDLIDMERMVNGYLDFVRGDGDEAFEEVEVRSIFEKISATLKRQNVGSELVVEGDLRLTVRPLAFERAMSNLLNNAAKYADHVWVRVFYDGSKIEIDVEDNGPGIPEDQYEAVFKPFTRVDTSRNAETGGVGLGLAVTMDIVHAHGGKIWLERSEHGGLKVVVRMPV